MGASAAGCFAAAAAARAGAASVTVVERDRLPAGPDSRRGVPQDRQPHVFLHRGMLAAEELLPGLRADLVAAGGVPLDTGELAWLGETGWGAPGRREFEIVSATRPLLDSVVRGRVSALPGVRLRDGVRATGLLRSSTGWEVTLEDGPAARADLVVDASGRSSRL